MTTPTRIPLPLRTATALACVAFVGLAACSSSTKASKQPTATPQALAASPTPSPTPTVQRPAGPAAAISGLSGGTGPYMGSANPPVLAPFDYVQQEYAASGTATSYKASGALSPDGQWTLAAEHHRRLPHPGTGAAPGQGIGVQRQRHRGVAERQRRGRQRPGMGHAE